MSVTSELNRLRAAKTEIKAAITAKGGILGEETISQYADVILALQSQGLYVWRVWDNDPFTYASEDLTTAAPYANCLSTVMFPTFTGKYWVAGFYPKQSESIHIIDQARYLVAKDGSCYYRPTGEVSGITTVRHYSPAILLGYVVSDDEAAYPDGGTANGHYYKRFTGDVASLTHSVTAGNTLEITQANVGYSSVYITGNHANQVATGTVTVTSSSPSTTGSLVISGIGFTPTSFVLTIVGTGSTNSICSVVALNTTTATYTRTTSGTSTSSPGTSTVTYAYGRVTVPQYNSSYNFKVGTWRWVAWT